MTTGVSQPSVMSPAYAASMSIGRYETSGWRLAAASISSFSMPS